MLKSMGNRDVLLMRGHGITVTGPSLEQATILAIRFNRVAKIMWEIALSGRDAPNLSDEDMARYDGRERPARGGWRNTLQGVENFGWNHYVRLLQANNIGLPDDIDAA
jgi:ribulose-5-phosphate 4-epimerase/fuculose-1-phosphate aldolase